MSYSFGSSVGGLYGKGNGDPYITVVEGLYARVVVGSFSYGAMSATFVIDLGNSVNPTCPHLHSNRK